MALLRRHRPEVVGKTVIISPHLDDAVLSCGDRMARLSEPTVVTVFAGGPSPFTAGGLPSSVTPWDTVAGFKPGDDTISRRRSEDQRALGVLGAHPLWLDFWDQQYGRTESAFEIAEALGRALVALQPEAVYFPMGLFHGDHRLTHDACLRLCNQIACDWVLYEEVIYRRYAGYSPQARLEQLILEGFKVEAPAIPAEPACERKREALRCYESQMQALGTTQGCEDMFSAERYYRLIPNSIPA
jgi:LmbE family N-acetylglucosaminyl deacetylase